MIRRISLILFVLVVHSVYSQEVDITRGQFWGRITVAPQFENGFSAILSASMRNNISITKEINGVEKSALEEGQWLNELYLGASWKKKVGNRSTFLTQLIYRPQFWYPDLKGGSPYLRNSLMSNSSLFHSLNRITIEQKLSLWALLAAEQETSRYDTELILRYLVGPSVKIGKRVNLSLKVEPFWKLTASDSDLDGTKIFSRFYTWAGFEFTPLRGVKLGVSYINMLIYQSENKQVVDHTVYGHVIFAPKWK